MALDTRLPLEVLRPDQVAQTTLKTNLMASQNKLAQNEVGQIPVDNQIKQLQVAQEKNNAIGQLLATANDQQTWSAARQRAATELGVDVSNVAEQFDPQVRQQFIMSTMSAGQQLQMQLSQAAAAIAAQDKAYDRQNDDRKYNLDVYKAQKDRVSDGLFMEDGTPLNGTTAPTGFVPGQPLGPSYNPASLQSSNSVLSVRNNNPGNMRGKDGNFATYDSPEAGLQAMAQDLVSKIAGKSPIMRERYGQGYTPTLQNVIETWAPPSENDTQGYVNFVAKQTGIDPSQPLSPMDVQKIAPAMIQMEGGQEASNYFGPNTRATEVSSTQTMPAAFAQQTPVKTQDGFVKPLFNGKGLPVNDGLEKGQQWGVNTQTGQRVAMDIPGFVTDEQRKLKETLPAAIESSQQALGLIDSLIGSEDGSVKRNESLNQAVGSKILSPDYAFGLKEKPFDGSGSADVNAVIDQLQGQNFLQAFQALKGGGAITQIEGEKAQNAIARLSTAQSDKAFESSLKELRGIIKKAIERNSNKLGGQTQSAAPSDATVDFSEYFK